MNRRDFLLEGGIAALGATTAADVAAKSDAAKGELPAQARLEPAAESRAAGAKFAAAVSVKDHGAVGDGETDDAPAIEAACAALSAAGGGALWYPPGTYLLGTLAAKSNNSFIRLRSNVSHIGAGMGVAVLKVKAGENARLRLANGPNVIGTAQANAVRNVTIRGLTFDWNGAANRLSAAMTVRNNASILTTNGASNMLIEACEFVETPGNQCVMLENGTYRSNRAGPVWIRDCVFRDCGSGLPGNHNQDHSSCYTRADDVTIESCKFVSSATVNGAAYELHGSRNVARGNRSIFYARPCWIASNDAPIEDILIEGESHTNCSYAMGITANEHAIDNILIRDSTFRQARGVAYGSVQYFFGGFTVAACDSLRIERCRFIGRSSPHLRFLQHYAYADFSFEQNTVSGFDDATNGLGIVASGVDIGNGRLAARIAIRANVFANVRTPIYFSAAKSVDLLDVTDNQFVHAGATHAVVISLAGGDGRTEGNSYSGYQTPLSVSGTNHLGTAYSPALSGSGAAGRIALGANTLRWERRDRWIRVWGFVSWRGGGGGSGILQIGLPAPATARPGHTWIGLAHTASLDWSAGRTHIVSAIASGASVMTISEAGRGAASSGTPWSASGDLWVDISYES